MPAPTLSYLRPGYRALVVGATGAIGSAWVAALRADPRCGEVIALSRRSHPGLDLLQEASIADCARWLSTQSPLHLVVDATGALTINGRGPEKRLDELDAAGLLQALHLNAVGPALLMRHFLPVIVDRLQATRIRLLDLFGAAHGATPGHA